MRRAKIATLVVFVACGAFALLLAGADTTNANTVVERSGGQNRVRISYRDPGADEGETSLFRSLPYLNSGSQFSVIATYSKQSNMLAFLDPPWVHVKWHSEILGNRLEQSFCGFVTNAAELKGLEDGITAKFTARIFPNEPDLDYYEKEYKLRIHHFNLKIDQDFEVIPVVVSPQDLLRILKAEVSANKVAIEAFCQKVGVPHVFDPDGQVPGPSPNVKYGWYDGNLAVTSVVSPLPVAGRKVEKRKFVRMSVLVEPGSGKVQEIILAEKVHVYPRD